MISPEDFVGRWRRFLASNPVLADDDDYRLRVANADDSRLRTLAPAASQFLLEAGLPKSFLYFISFENLSAGLKQVHEVYSPYSWTAEEKDALQNYLLIGSDDADNPICLDEIHDGQIVVLDHDDCLGFWQFVNSSIPQLAEFLLAVGIAQPGDGLKVLLESIDAPAMQEGSFWRSRLNNLL